MAASSELPPTIDGGPPPAFEQLFQPPAGEGLPPSPSPRYRLVQFHAKGGLGCVWRAFDVELGREVALKQLIASRADEPLARKRFTREAEITGRLEHPGIVPVYSAGHDAVGRPFYTMRFIAGQSFREAIIAYFRPPPTRTAAEQRRQLRGLIQRLIVVCQTIQYVHCKGVLHRDLKPDNVLLGEHGETLVIDWGLAKVLDTSDDLAPLLLPGTALTKSGVVLGTPGFLAPEQALGQSVSPATDVYGLGGILYALLTGRPPIVGDTFLQIAELTAAGLIPWPRQLRRDVPPELDAICRKALARRPEDRYPTAQALADDLDCWLADTPLSVYRPGLLRRLRAPVLLFAGLLLAVVGLQVWLGTRPAAVSPPVSAPVSVQVPAPVPDAKIARQVVRTAVTLPLTPETTALVKAVQPELEAWLQQRDTPADERGEMWAALGTWAAHAGQAELAIRHWQAALTAYREVADLVSVARPTALVQQQLAAQARATQRWPAAEEHYRAARGLLELVRTHPQIGPSVRAELARVLTALGEAYQAQEQIDAAHRAYTEAEREYADLERTPAGALAETQLRLTHAKLLLKQQRTSEAAPVLERGRDLLPPLAHASQASTEQLELLLALWLLSAEVEQARNEPAARRTALETAQQVRQLLQMRQPQRADATQVQIDQGLAETLLEQGQFAAALTAAQSAVQQREQLVQAAPTDVGRLRDLVRAQAVLAQIHLRQNQPALAVPGLRALVQTRQRLVNLQPDQVVPAVDLAWANNSLGLALHNSQQTSEAIAAYQAAQAAVAEWEAHATEWKEPALVAGGAACNLAQCLLAANQVDAAQASVTVASARLQRLYTAEPMFRSVKLFLRNTHWTAARVDSRAGRHAQVLVAVTAAEQLSGATNLPLDLQVLRALALVHTDQVAAGLAAVEHVSTRSPYVLYNLACVWSVASTKGMSAERGARAVRLLRSAYAAGFREVTGLQADADLAPLRTRADYQQFLRELTATERAPAPRLQP